MADNYSHKNIPRRIFRQVGMTTDTFPYVGFDSTAIYAGSVVALMSDVSTGIADGVKAWTDGDPMLGVAMKFTTNTNDNPVQLPKAKYNGTITNATSINPMKYTFNAANDTSNATPYLDLVHVDRFLPGDIWEFTLVDNAGTAVSTRGTTTGSGKQGYFLGINTTSPFALNETTATTTGTGLDFMVVNYRGTQPVDTSRVYVTPVFDVSKFNVAQS